MSESINNDFQCPEHGCGRSFRSGQGLQQHLNSAQHGLTCRQCPQRFGTTHSLRTHEQNVHANNAKQQSNQQQQQQPFVDPAIVTSSSLAVPASRSSQQQNQGQSHHHHQQQRGPREENSHHHHHHRDEQQNNNENRNGGGGRRLGTASDSHHHHHHHHDNNNNNDNRRRQNNNNDDYYNDNNNDRRNNNNQRNDDYGRGRGGNRGRGDGRNYNNNNNNNNRHQDPFANREAPNQATSWGGFGGNNNNNNNRDQREANSFRGRGASAATSGFGPLPQQQNNSNDTGSLLSLQQQLLQGGGGENTGLANGVNRQSKNFYDKIVHQFTTSKEAELTFPPTLTPAQRQQVHRLAANYGLQHKSHGEGANRCIRLTKTSSAKEFYTNVQPLNDRNLMISSTEAPSQSMEKLVNLVEPEFQKMNSILNRLQTDQKFRQQIEMKSLGSQKAQIITHHSKKAPPPPTSTQQQKDNNQQRNNNHNDGNDNGAMTPQEARKHLPVYAHRQEIIHAVQKHDVVLISATTGAGKTTGVPAYLLESGIFPRDSFILCTQPRRISAISVASRVAQEKNEPLGASVGYTVRFDSATTSATRLVYMTTGILLRRLHSDPTLQDVAAVVVDEVHERDMNTDFVLMLLKDLIHINAGSKRKFPLKLIVMSATMQTEKLLDYLTSVASTTTTSSSSSHQASSSKIKIPHISIAGTLHPVRSFFLEDVHRMLQMPQLSENDINRQFGAAIASVAHQHGSQQQQQQHHQKDNDQAFDNFAEKATIMSADRELESFVPFNTICNLVREIHTREKDRNNNSNNNGGLKGAILIFLPGWAAIDKLMKMFRELYTHQLIRELSILPLHSSLSLSEQRLVFDPPPRGFRKIILATNIAETSITVEDVVFVIDTCLHKSTHYDSAGNTTALQCQLVSQSNCTQRRGRAGRVRAGDCYHLVPKKIFDQLPKFLAPEMLRSALLDVCLQSKAIMPSKKVIDFLATAMDPPPEKSIEHAVAHLMQLGAFNGKEVLTGLGRALAHMPIDCVLGKMLLLGACTGVLDAMTVITASLGAKSPFVRAPLHLAKEAAAARARCAGTSASDHIAILNLYRKWKAASRPAHVAQEFWADHLVLNNIDRTVKQLKQAVLDSGFVRLPNHNINGNNNMDGEDDDDNDTNNNNNNNRRGGGGGRHNNNNNHRVPRGKLDESILVLDSIASKNGDNTSLIQLCLSMALYPNFASKEVPVKRRRNQQWICWDEKHSQISPSSVVASCSTGDLFGREFVVFFDRMRIETQVVMFDATALPRSLMSLGCRYLDKLDEGESRVTCNEVAEQNPDCLYLPLDRDFIGGSKSANNNNNRATTNDDDDGEKDDNNNNNNPAARSVPPNLPSGFSTLVVDEGMKRWGAPAKAVDVIWKLHCALHFFFSFSCQQMRVTEFPTESLAKAIAIIGGTPIIIADEVAAKSDNNDKNKNNSTTSANSTNQVRVLMSANPEDLKKKPVDNQAKRSSSSDDDSDGDEVLPTIVAVSTTGDVVGFSSNKTNAGVLAVVDAKQLDSLSAMFGDLAMFKHSSSNNKSEAETKRGGNNNDDDE